MSINNEQNHEAKLNQITTAESDDARAKACARTDGVREAVAVPSNTATNNCISEENVKESINENSKNEVNRNKEIVREEEFIIKFLRWGIDSLYLSYQGNIHTDIDQILKTLKSHAQSEDKTQQALAQYVIGDHIFEVKDKGSSFFTYILEDNAFRVALSRPNKAVPMAYVKISSEYLSYKSPVDAEFALREILEHLGVLESSANVSRIDMFLDFACDYPMDSWNREAWVTRAANISHYSVDQHFTGWAIGQGSAISARLYNKTLEIIKSGKGYLHPLWKQSGWDGEMDVWRLEFQFKHEFLDQKGIIRLSDVLNHLNGLWSYGTTEWLKLTIPNIEDKTRSRWPIHPLWLTLSTVDWETSGGALKSRFENVRVPKNSAIFNRAFSALTSWMAANGRTDYQTSIHPFLIDLESHIENEANSFGFLIDTFVSQKVAFKARQFNTLINPPAEEPIDQAEAYRRASDGE